MKGLVNKATSKLLVVTCITFLQFMFFRYLHGYFTSAIYNSHRSTTGKVLLVDLGEDSTTSSHQIILNKMLNQGLKDESAQCSAYFSHLFYSKENFTAIDANLLDLKYDTQLDTLSSHDYFDKENNRIKQEFKKSNRDLKDINTREILEKVNRQISDNGKYSESLIDSVSALRWYLQCQGQFTTHEQCLEIESRLFPWFTFELPIFTRWDGTQMQKFPHIQVFDNENGKIKVHQHDHVEKSDLCFWSNFNSNYNEKGIVVPIKDESDLKHAAKLIKVLRFLGNKLPLQIVYNSKTLKAESSWMEALVGLSREIIIFRSSLDKISTHKQELWFVDIGPVFSDDYPAEKFEESHQFASTVFSSFEQIIYMSPKVVPMQDLSKLLDVFQTGDELLLFRSRQTNSKLVENYHKLISALFPSNLEKSVKPEFQKFIPPQNRYLDPKGSSSLTDSGLFAIDKSNKLAGMLMSMHLKLVTNIHASELIWLGQALQGSSFTHNEKQPGAIGEPATNHLDQPAIASRQTAQFMDNSLYWIGNGFQICDQDGKNLEFNQEYEAYEKDANKPAMLKGIGSSDELKSKYEDLIPLSAVIIPPELEINEKAESWTRTKYCGGQIFKAQSITTIPNADGGSDTRSGKLIKFSGEKLDFYKRIRDVWNTKVKLAQLDLED